MKRKKLNRVIIYLVGMAILAAGITMNTKTGLGVSPIVSVSYCVSTILGVNFGNATLVWYGTFVVVEVVLHLLSGRKKLVIADLLQFPMALLFTRLLNLFGWLLPDVTYVLSGQLVLNMVVRLLVLGVAIMLVGIGASMTLQMRLVPNPGDGIVQALADYFHKELGFTKNCFDAFCILLAFFVGLFSGRLFLGIGVGTVLAVLGTGRAIALFNHFFLSGLLKMTGMEAE